MKTFRQYVSSLTPLIIIFWCAVSAQLAYGQGQQPCDDGDPCTVDVKDMCGNCFHIKKSCDDGNPATLDFCDEKGECKHVPISCDDNNPNTMDYVDDKGVCHHVYNLCCDDGNPCTVDTFDPTTGKCINTPKNCDDGDPCTKDWCENGVCKHEKICDPCENKNCDDGDPCTKDWCEDGKCYHEKMDCDDGDPCTKDWCEDGKCYHEKMNCDDGDPCTKDWCEDGKCYHEKMNCDDGDPCTKDWCEDGKCYHEKKNCDDGDPCTKDWCEDGKCYHEEIPGCKECAQLGSNGCKPEVAAFFDGCYKVTACSGKDLSNVVLDLAPAGPSSNDIKYDGLSGYSKMFTSTQPILGIWIKSGCNQSGDCPGCGEYIENPNNCGAVAPRIRLNFNQKESDMIKLFPNPGTEWVVLDIPQTIIRPIGVVIIDAAGKRVFAEENVGDARDVRIELKLFNEGVYVVRIQSGEGKIFTKQLIVAKE